VVLFYNWWEMPSISKNKKIPPITEGVDAEILEQAKLALRGENPKPLPKCVICHSDSAPNSTENLCWVCRRLKISAWRESEQQINVQE
jgi:hypothetical protein